MKQAIQKLNELPRGQKINLVMSGGAIKGAAHLPLLEYIEERGLVINAISGTSAGALIGGFYASGKSPQEILHIFKTNRLFKYSWIKPLASGVFNSMKFVNYLEGEMKKSFEELSLPLTVCATDMNKAEAIYFTEGDLWRKIIASCAVPGIFSAVKIDGHLYSDGAVMDNFPIKPFLDDDLPIIGSLLTSPNFVEDKKLSRARKVFKRSVYLQKHAMELHKFDKTYVTFFHDLMHFSAFKQSNAQKIYDHTKGQLNQ